MINNTNKTLNTCTSCIKNITQISQKDINQLLELLNCPPIKITDPQVFTNIQNIFEKPLLTFKNSFLAILPELFLFITIIALLIYGLIFSTNRKNKNIFICQEILWLSCLTLILTICILTKNPFSNIIIFNNTLFIDNICHISKIITLSAIILTFLISFQYLKIYQINSYEYNILILISTLGTMFLISSYDLLSLYLALETQTLAFYVLTTYNRLSAYSTEAGLKYFILGALSSGLLLFGISLIYGITGTINFTNLSYISQYYNYISTSLQELPINSIKDLTQIITFSSIEFKIYLLGIVFITSALLFKLAAVPFHMWTPDVYEGAPTTITTFFAIIPKLPFFLIIIKLFYFNFYSIIHYIEFILIICAGLSMIIGSISALQQQKIKRLFVYSSISHLGYMLIGLTSSTLLGLQGLFLYLIIYMITNLGLWTIFLSLNFKNKIGFIKYITDVTGLAQTNPYLSFCFTIILCSMAGIPPLAGFYPKLFMFMAAFQSNLPILPFIGIISSLISAFYYLQIIKIMYFDKTQIQIEFEQIPQINALIISLVTLFLLLFFLMPNFILFTTYKMAFLSLIF